MNEKSHVSMERHVCIICGIEYDTGAILLDRRLRASMDRYTTTGHGLCAEDQRRFNDGFIALVECDPARSGHPLPGGVLRPDEAYRTGNVAHLKREAFARIFNTSFDTKLPFVFVELGVLEKLRTMVRP